MCNITPDNVSNSTLQQADKFISLQGLTLATDGESCQQTRDDDDVRICWAHFFLMNGKKFLHTLANSLMMSKLFCAVLVLARIIHKQFSYKEKGEKQTIYVAYLLRRVYPHDNSLCTCYAVM